MSDATQSAPELQSNSTRRRIAPAVRRSGRYIDPITALQLRLMYLLIRFPSDTDLAEAFGVSRATVSNHTKGRNLSRDRSLAANVIQLRELWAKEAKAVHLNPDDFVPVYLGVWTRFDPAMMEAISTVFQKSIDSPLKPGAI